MVKRATEIKKEGHERMRREFKRVLASVLVFGVCASSVVSGAQIDAKVKKAKISKTSLSLQVSKTTTLKLTKVNKKAKVTWTVNRIDLVKLSKKTKTSCKVKGLKKGTATVTAKVKVAKKTQTLKCKVKVTMPKVVDNASLKETYKDIVPYMGAAVNYGSKEYPRDLLKEDTMAHIKKHYNSFTLENEMKPDNILGSTAKTMTLDEAKAKGYFIPANYADTTVPTLNFEEVDGALTVAAQNDLKMRAHTLVWHSQTPSWFFVKDYKGNIVADKDVMTARLEFYVHNVMGHVMDKEKELKGEAGSIVYAWDVVNEYLHRMTMGRTWTSVYGDEKLEPTYVKKAFEFAYDMVKSYQVEDKVSLISNDYNTYFSINDELALIEFINKDEPAKICSGIGMQSHIDVQTPTPEVYGAALEKFLAAGLEVQITELDFTINFDTTGSYAYRNEGETDVDQAKYVKKIMETIITKQKNRDKTVNPKGITSITLWGLHDAMSWRGDCAPLLFGSGINDPKLSYNSFIEAAKVWQQQ